MSKKQHENKQDKEILELFSKLEVNIPLLDLIKKVPKYAKFLKDLCTHKRKFKPNEKVQVSSNVSALFKPQLPIKCKDPGSFTIPCTIGKVTINGALLDLGAAINVMPKSVYECLGIKTLKSTSMTLQLADRTCRKPQGIVEDVLVKVKELVFPADFYVLDMDENKMQDSTLILGRPFLRTAKTMIDMKEGSITMEVGDQKIGFNMYEAMRYPNEDYSLLDVNVVHAFDNPSFTSSPTNACVGKNVFCDVMIDLVSCFEEFSEDSYKLDGVLTQKVEDPSVALLFEENKGVCVDFEGVDKLLEPTLPSREEIARSMIKDPLTLFQFPFPDLSSIPFNLQILYNLIFKFDAGLRGRRFKKQKFRIKGVRKRNGKLVRVKHHPKVKIRKSFAKEDDDDKFTQTRKKISGKLSVKELIHAVKVRKNLMKIFKELFKPP